MATRGGMANLITRLRAMVDDAGTATWQQQRLQDVLDSHSEQLWQVLLAPLVKYVNGTATYKTYAINYTDLEELSADDTDGDRWRIYDSIGRACGTADYSVNYYTGRVTFKNDQAGSARYLDAWRYDLFGAAAELWRERSGLIASKYSFSADGGSFQRAQWFEHCEKMASKYECLSWPITVGWERNDGTVE
jgi:hypothetical protein